MKRLIVGAMCIAVAAVGAVATPAQARGGCATRAEYRHVHTGTPLDSVAATFGARYRIVYDDTQVFGGVSYRDLMVSFKKCKGFDGGRGVVAFYVNDYTNSVDVNDFTLRLVERNRFSWQDLSFWGGNYNFRTA